MYSTYNNFLCIKNIDRDTLDLDKTFDCGQCFRWRKLPDGTWIGVVADKIFMLKHKNIDGIDCIITTATQEEWENILYKYLDLDTDYSKLTVPDGDTFAIEAMQAGKGIRILRQDAWESIISFIISQRNNIPKIKSTIKKLCEEYGNEIEIEVNGEVYKEYTFPTAERLAECKLVDIKSIGLGYRDIYILMAAKDVVDGRISIDKLINCNNADCIIEELKSMVGVGPKVANCIALFGLHKLETFPIDVWMQRIIDTEYNGHLDYKAYGSLAGLLQQYMFYYMKYKKS